MADNPLLCIIIILLPGTIDKSEGGTSGHFPPACPLLPSPTSARYTHTTFDVYLSIYKVHILHLSRVLLPTFPHPHPQPHHTTLLV
ncbi:hypothetical protein F5Y07DRAFT_66809 [Xylaria sp. FL0933]|nr:hypothetical protein F5Y07DRAFT_66809 [Xylaria sp. FL0933]